MPLTRPTVQVSLTNAISAYVRSCVGSGQFRSADELVRTALLLHKREAQGGADGGATEMKLRLADRLAALDNPRFIMAEAAAQLGTHLRADRVFYTEIEPRGARFVVSDDWTAGDMPSLAGQHRLEAFGGALAAALRQGETVAFADMLRDPLTKGAATASAFAAVNTRAAIIVPLLESGVFRAALCVHHATARAWTDVEIALVSDVAERTRSAVARTRAEATLRDNAARLRLALEASDLGIWEIDLETDTPTLSPALGRLFGYDATPADWNCTHFLDHVIPEDRDRGAAHNAAARQTGCPLHVECRIRRADGALRWIALKGKPLPAAEGRPARLHGTTADITDRKQAELALIASETRLRAAIEAVHGVVWTADATGAFAGPQPGWTALTGLSDAECRDLGRFAAVHPDDIESTQAAWEAALDPRGSASRNVRAGASRDRRADAPCSRRADASGNLHAGASGNPPGSLGFQQRVRRGDGVWRQFSVRAVPTFNDDGTVHEWIGIHTDITEQTESDNVRQLLARLVEQSGDFVAVTDIDAGVLFLNAAGCRLVGLADLQAARATSLADYLAPASQAMLANEVRPALDRDDSWAGELEFRHFGTGATVPVLASIFPVRGHGGVLLGYGAVSRDLSEARRVEAVLQRLNETLEQQVAERTAQLHASQARLRMIFETSQHLQGLLSPDGIVLDANRASLQTFGATLADVLDKPAWQIEWVAAVPGVPAAIKAAIAAAAEGTALHQQVPLRLASGVHWFDLTLRPIRDPAGNVLAIVPEAADITDRRLAEEALLQSQKMEAVGQLTGGLAHDFNNLLTSIGGSLELLSLRLSQGSTADMARYLAQAQAACGRAAAVTRRLLAFARRQSLDPRPTEIDKLVAGMLDMIRRTVGPEVAVETSAVADVWPTLVDPNQLENALLNLCINARDAMHEGGRQGGRLTIETTNRHFDSLAAKQIDLPPGDYVSLAVSDTGTGMTPEVMAQAFDAFFTTKPAGQGTGLGLSMAYGFALQAGGFARIYSEVGKGTTVALHLPRHLGDASRVAAPEQAAASPRAHAGETVLVVDDEPVVRMLVSEVLVQLGYTALQAADGADCMKILQSDVRIDLMVTDVGLPGGMNGNQVAEQARVVRPKIKVLFITGYAENAALSYDHLQHGMQVMTKPFGMQDLASRIRGLIADA